MKYENTGNFLKQARESEGLSQAELAEKLGLENAQSISNIERGLTSIPRKYVFQVAFILKIQPADLIDAMIEDVRNKYLR